MKKFGLCIVTLIIIAGLGLNSSFSYARDYEKEDEEYERQLAEETEEIERFIGMQKDAVWQIFCTEMYQILQEDIEMYKDGYITEASYSDEVGYAASFSKNIQSMSEDSIRWQEHTWTYGFKEDVVVEETRYYRLNKALEYYLQTQIALGEPVVFDYTEYEQSLFDDDAKNGVMPEIETEEEIEVEDEITEQVIVENEEENIESKSMKDKFISFMLSGGITLSITVVLGVILIYINMKKRKKEKEELE